MDKQTALQFQPPAPLPEEDRSRLATRCAKCLRSFSGGGRFCPYDGERLEPVESSPEDPLLGSVVDGRFEVLALLGEGGMGIVYRVRHRVLGREFALKALRADIAQEEQLGARFLREAQSAASINHPNVCEITDFGELDGGRPYFVMELLTGESLSALLQRERLPLGRVVRLSEQIARALDAAHRAGVVHRDLKPDNILIEATPTDERVKVVDFGLAQVAGHSRLTQPGIVFGTPHYMSPEQASGGEVDPRADIYALGILMYEMLTGKVPFEAETYMGVLSKHLYLEPRPPSELVPGGKIGALEGVVLRCLEKRPENRYATMATLLDELRGIVRVDAGQVSVRPGALGPSATPPSAAARKRLAQRSPVLALVVMALVLMGAVALGLLWLRRAPPPARTPVASSPDSPALVVPVEPLDSVSERDVGDTVPALLASGPADEVPAGAGGTLPSAAPVREPSSPPPRRSEGVTTPEPTAKASDPGPPDERLPKRRKRPDFQTSEIIDPWSQ